MPTRLYLSLHSFKWDDKALQAFETIKQAMISTPVLALPNCSKAFVLETGKAPVTTYKRKSKKGLETMGLLEPIARQ